MSSDTVGAAYDRIFVLHRRGTLTALDVLREVLGLLDAGVLPCDVTDFLTIAESRLAAPDQLELQAQIAARIGARMLRLRRGAEQVLSSALIEELLKFWRPGDETVRDVLSHVPEYLRRWWREETGEE